MTLDENYYSVKCEEKARIIAELIGQSPCEAIGVSEEIYTKWKPSTRYTKLCGVIKICKQRGVERKVAYSQELIWFKKFLDIATTNEKDSLLGLINDTIAKADERKKVKDEIELKRKELKELESKYNSL